MRNGENGRAGEIRTHDLLHPMQARYQATLQPEQITEGSRSGMARPEARAFSREPFGPPESHPASPRTQIQSPPIQQGALPSGCSQTGEIATAAGKVLRVAPPSFELRPSHQSRPRQRELFSGRAPVFGRRLRGEMWMWDLLRNAGIVLIAQTQTATPYPAAPCNAR